MCNSLDLRISEAKEFLKSAEELGKELRVEVGPDEELEELQSTADPIKQEKIQPRADGSALQNALEKYIGLIGSEKLRSPGPGLAAELNAVMGTIFPIEKREEGGITRLIVDLSALYAWRSLDANYMPENSYFKQWLQLVSASPVYGGDDFVEGAPLFIDDAPYVIDKLTLDLEFKKNILGVMGDLFSNDDYDPAQGLNSETVPGLEQIDAKNGISAIDLLNLYIWKRQGRSIGDLGRVIRPLNDSIDTTLIYWAERKLDNDSKHESRRVFARHLFIDWEWIREIRFGPVVRAAAKQVSEDYLERLTQPRLSTSAQKFNSSFKEYELAKYEEQIIENIQFPRVLDDEVKYGFNPVSVLVIGPPETGKTSFLCALKNEIDENGNTLKRGQRFIQSGLNAFYQKFSSEWSDGAELSENGDGMSRTQKYYYLECEVNGNPTDGLPSMPLAIIDYPGEMIDPLGGRADEEFHSSILSKSQGLIIIFDSRMLKPETGRTHRWEDKYLEILDAFLSKNPGAPVAILVNKADLIFGDGWFAKFDGMPKLLGDDFSSSEILEGNASFVGLQEPYERFKSYILGRPAININFEMRPVFEKWLEDYQAFFQVLLEKTTNYEFFLSDSRYRLHSTSQGSRESMSWITNVIQLLFAKRAQKVAETDKSTTEQAIESIEMRRKEALSLTADILKDYKKLDEIIGSMGKNVITKTLNGLLGKNQDEFKNRIKSNSEKLTKNLEYELEQYFPKKLDDDLMMNEGFRKTPSQIGEKPLADDVNDFYGNLLERMNKSRDIILAAIDSS